MDFEMRYLYIVFALLMLLFMAVQYNDPDGPLWIAIYMVPTIWSAVAAFKPSLLLQRLPSALLLLSIAGALAGTIYYWPDSAQWWSKQVWMEAETAREGMGMMIVMAIMLIVWFTTRRSSSVPSS